jgi:hypothetical protein
MGKWTDVIIKEITSIIPYIMVFSIAFMFTTAANTPVVTETIHIYGDNKVVYDIEIEGPFLFRVESYYLVYFRFEPVRVIGVGWHNPGYWNEVLVDMDNVTSIVFKSYNEDAIGNITFSLILRTETQLGILHLA